MSIVLAGIWGYAVYKAFNGVRAAPLPGNYPSPTSWLKTEGGPSGLPNYNCQCYDWDGYTVDVPDPSPGTIVSGTNFNGINTGFDWVCDCGSQCQYDPTEWIKWTCPRGGPNSVTSGEGQNIVQVVEYKDSNGNRAYYGPSSPGL